MKETSDGGTKVTDTRRYLPPGIVPCMSKVRVSKPGSAATMLLPLVLNAIGSLGAE